MGRQVNFFFSQKDEQEFISNAVEDKFLIMDLLGHIIKNPNECILTELVFALPDAPLIYSNNRLRDSESEIIIYSRCILKDGSMERGRIWAEFKYWDSNSELVKKSESFEKAYTQMSRWIKKNSKIDLRKSSYIGSDAYKLYKDNSIKMILTPRLNAEWN